MPNVLIERLRQGYRTTRFPDQAPAFPAQYRGRPALEAERCPDGCQDCTSVCPTQAVTPHPLRIDLGACLFCGRCQESCSQGAITFTRDYQLSVRRREELILSSRAEAQRVDALEKKMLRLFGRSLKLRQVSAGGCNGCEVELAVLGIVVFDLGRFGIQFVASPRHADGLLVTGPVTNNMILALRETYEAVPAPKLVIAVGACALSGGPFAGAQEIQGIPQDIQVDLFIPGCPPHPYTTLDGLLRLLGRIAQRK